MSCWRCLINSQDCHKFDLEQQTSIINTNSEVQRRLPSRDSSKKLVAKNVLTSTIAQRITEKPTTFHLHAEDTSHDTVTQNTTEKTKTCSSTLVNRISVFWNHGNFSHDSGTQHASNTGACPPQTLSAQSTFIPSRLQGTLYQTVWMARTSIVGDIRFSFLAPTSILSLKK
jgi:hypothetical protein